MDPLPTSEDKLPAGVGATISVIDSASLSNLPLEPYFDCDLPRLQRVTVPAFSFVITNQRGRSVLFDLGLRKDWPKLPPTAVAEIHNDQLGIHCEQDVLDILEAQDFPIENVEAIVLRLFAPSFPHSLFFHSLKINS